MRSLRLGMTSSKRRLTVTVDPNLVEAANRAVEAGEAASLSGWVSAAMAEKARRDDRLALSRAAVVDYESEFGEITAAEIAAVKRADRADAIVLRGRSAPGQRRRSARRRPT